MMVRGGWKDADKGAAVTLWLGSAVAVPIGLYFTQNVSAELSQTVALCLILVLAVTQLANMRLAFLNTRAGLVSAGIGAGMQRALPLSAEWLLPYMFCHLTVTRAKCGPRWSCSCFWEQLRPLQHYYCLGFWTKSLCCAQRPNYPTSLGVFAGKRLFTPNFEPYYRPICLSLLVGLSMIGLIRLAT